MKRFAAPILLLVLLTAASMSYGVRLSYFDVTPEGRDFSLAWQMDVEDGVREYQLMRRTPYSNDAFVSVQEFQPHGAGRTYSYRDNQVYKTTADQLDYRLEVVYENGLREVVVTRSLNYTTTAVRRTWGSIKAMFQ